MTPLAYGWSHEPKVELGSPASIVDPLDDPAYAPSPSSYSSLEGWAGSPLPHQASPISSPLAKAHCHYVGVGEGPRASPSVMDKAFDAAGYSPWADPFLYFSGGGVGSPDALAHAPGGTGFVWGAQDLAAYQFPALAHGPSRLQDDF